MRNQHYCNNKCTRWIGLFLPLHRTVALGANGARFWCFKLLHIFYYQDSKKREDAIFILLYHFHLLANLQKFIWSFASDITIFYFRLQSKQLLGSYYMWYIHNSKLIQILIECSSRFSYLFYVISYCNNFSQTNTGFDLASTIYPSLQTKQLT